MDKSGENEARGVNSTVDVQEIASSNSTKVGTKVAPQKKLEKKDLKASDDEADYFDIICTVTGEKQKKPKPGPRRIHYDNEFALILMKFKNEIKANLMGRL